MISLAQQRYVGLAMIGHWNNSRNTEVHLETGNGGCCSIWGNEVRAVADGVPVVTLCHQSNNPLAALVRPDAWENFEAAALLLALEGREFCTVMQPNQNLPILRWTKECR